MSPSLTGFRRYPLLCLLGIYTAVFLFNGFAFADLADYMRIPFDLTRIMEVSDRQFLYSSPLNYFIAYVFHLRSIIGFFALHSFEIVAMLGCAYAAIRRKIPGAEQQTRFIVLLSLTPLWYITLKWFGKTDPVLIGGLMLCWAFPTRWRILIVAVMVLAHREIGTVMAVTLFFLEDRRDSNLLLAALLGNGLHLLYQYGVLDYPPQSRSDLVIRDTELYLMVFIGAPAMYFMSMFSWYWVAICVQKPAWKEGVALAGAFILALVCADFTRVFILLALPPVLFHIEQLVVARKHDWLGKLAPLMVLHFQVAAAQVPTDAFDNIVLISLVRNLRSLFR